jgi:EAL domain-containing protein (putative c-di-GMP-specific phosphodiesterase class I)
VHARLLAAVQGNHGNAFRRILASLELPHERIVLQLPAVTHGQNWILNVVSENYRCNGFRLAVNANTIAEASILLDHVRPDVVKLDARRIGHSPAMHKLLAEAAKRGIRVIFKRVETASQLSALRQIGGESGQPIHVQGFLWDLPQALLVPVASSGTLFRGPEGGALGRKVA